MQNTKITILTKPIGGDWAYWVFENLKNLAKSIRNFIFSGDFSWPDHLGHLAVTRSLVDGLKKIGANFNYNPKNFGEVGETVVILHNLKALEQAATLKQSGKIKKILVWSIIGKQEFEKEIDIFLVPSLWVKENDIENNPGLADRIKVWYSGVDENFWKAPAAKKQTKNVLMYYKNAPDVLFLQVDQALRKAQFNPMKIKYGRYSQNQFRRLLAQSQFAVFFSSSESQGLALAESWSMDVPTFCWDPKEPITYIGRQFKNISSCPYLTSQTGKTWRTLVDFEGLLKEFQLGQLNFTPRNWVLNNMTDEVSARLLLNLCLNA